MLCDVQPEVPHACYNAGVRDLSERDQAGFKIEM